MYKNYVIVINSITSHRLILVELDLHGVVIELDPYDLSLLHDHKSGIVIQASRKRVCGLSVILSDDSGDLSTDPSFLLPQNDVNEATYKSERERQPG